VLVLGVGWPAVALVRRALSPIAGRPGLSVSTLAGVVGDDRTWRLLAVTVAQAAVSSAIATVLGVTVAWCLARRRVIGGRLALQLSLLAFVVPTLAMGAAVRQLADSAPLASPHPWVLIVVAHVWFNIGFVARALLPVFESVAHRYDNSARLLGRGPAGAALVVLRLVAPDVAGVAGLVGIFSATSFGVILALGGGSVTTLEVEVWYQATRLVDLPVAAILSGVQLSLVGLALFSINRLARRSGHIVRSGWAPTNRRGAARPRSPQTRSPQTRTPQRGRSDWMATTLVWAIVGSSAVLPLVGLVRGSLRSSTTWTLDYVSAAFDPPAQLSVAPGPALLRSLTLAITAGVAAGGIAVMLLSAGRSGWSRRVAVGPLGASGATVGLAWLIAYRWPIDLRGTIWIVLGVQVAVITPLVLLLVGPVWDDVDDRWLDVAAMSGAGRWRWSTEVRWPIVRPILAVAVGLAAAAALGEIGATSVVGTDRHATAPIVIQQLLARPGELSRGVASALSLLLVLLAGGVVAVAALMARPRRSRVPGRSSDAR